MAKDNLAYDLSAYEQSIAQEAQQKKPELRAVRSTYRAFAGALTLRALVPFTIVMVLLSLMVYNHVYLNELTRQASNLQGQLAILESESIRYSSLLESTVSLRAIAGQAEEMGMVRLDPYRTVHVYLQESDQIILFAGQPDYQPSGLLAMIGSIISSVRNIMPQR